MNNNYRLYMSDAGRLSEDEALAILDALTQQVKRGDLAWCREGSVSRGEIAYNATVGDFELTLYKPPGWYVHCFVIGPYTTLDPAQPLSSAVRAYRDLPRPVRAGQVPDTIPVHNAIDTLAKAVEEAWKRQGLNQGKRLLALLTERLDTEETDG